MYHPFPLHPYLTKLDIKPECTETRALELMPGSGEILNKLPIKRQLKNNMQDLLSILIARERPPGGLMLIIVNIIYVGRS